MDPILGDFVTVIISDKHCTFTLHYTSILSNTLCQFLYDAVRADELDCGENGEVDAGQELQEHPVCEAQAGG